MGAKKKFFLIDGCALAYRSRHEFSKQPLINSKGLNTTTLFLFASTIFSILEEENPFYLAVVFDAPSPSFRHQIYPEYRTTMDQLPAEMIPQFSLIYKMLEAFNIPILSLPGYEADDLISTYVEFGRSLPDLETFIVSGEKNIMQLVGPQVFLYQMKGGAYEIWGADKILEKFSMRPDQMVDFLSLMGDQSDNIPGVPAIGERSACFLLQEYGTLENALTNAKAIKRKNIRENLLRHREMVLLSKQLVSLKKDIPLTTKISELKVRQKNETALFHLLQNFEFSQYLSKLSKQKQQLKQEFFLVSSKLEFERFLKIFSMKRKFSFYFLYASTCLSPDSVIGLAIAFSPSLAYYLPLETESDFERLKLLAPFFEDSQFQKVGSDLKSLLKFLPSLHLNLKPPFFDVMLSGIFVHPGEEERDLKKQILKHLNIILEDPEELKNRYPRGHLTKRQLEIACDYASSIWSLAEYYQENLTQQRLSGFFENVEMPLISILAEVEFYGISFDRDRWLSLVLEWTENVKKQENVLFQNLGEEVDLRSESAVLNYLQKKGLVSTKTVLTSEGASDALSAPSASKWSFLSPYRTLPQVQEFLSYNVARQIKETFAEVYHEGMALEDQRYRSNFLQCADAWATVQPLSPIFQNLSLVSKKHSFRHAFVATFADSLLLSAQYEELDLRVFAYFSQDKQLSYLLSSKRDFWELLQSKVASVENFSTLSLESFQKQVRAWFYGNYSEAGGELEKNLRKWLQHYFEGFFQWQQQFFERVKKKGVIFTLLGRVYSFSELRSTSKREVLMAQRQALLTMVGASQNEIFKMALVSIVQQIQMEQRKCRLLLPLPEEMLFEVGQEDLTRVEKIIQKEMETAVIFNVPLRVSIGKGKNWGLAYSFREESFVTASSVSPVVSEELLVEEEVVSIEPLGTDTRETEIW